MQHDLAEKRLIINIQEHIVYWNYLFTFALSVDNAIVHTEIGNAARQTKVLYLNTGNIVQTHKKLEAQL